MKKWTILLLTAALILQTACSDTPRVSIEELTQRSEVQVEDGLDQQKNYPAERPVLQKEDTSSKAEEQKRDEETTPEEESAVEIPPQDEIITEIPTVPAPQPEVPVAPVVDTPPIIPEDLSKEEPAAEETKPSQNQSVSNEIRAIWFSYFELESMLMGQSEKAFVKNIGTAFDNVVALGLNTVIVQVRPYADAIYPSEFFPWSYLATGTEGGNPGFDPLKILVREAHNRGLSIEAWINPYRVRNSNYKKELSEGNVVEDYLKSGDAIEYNGGIYFDPASEKAQKLIVNGVKEIVEKYRVDGIHFDDYFYPTTDESFDKNSYSAYKKAGGHLALADWRRENVNQLVRAVYSAVHDAGEDIRFGISPQGNLENNYNKQFIDVALWLSEKGYVDYICPQIYFGFENSTSPYAETVEQWNDLISLSSVDLLVGLSPYKVGTEDTWAGDGKNEWKQNSDILSRMVDCAREEPHYDGFVLFRYDSVFHPTSVVKSQINKEIDNLKMVLE